MELLLLVSTMRRASAESITAVIPYYGYGRADRKFTSRVPISAADLAVMLSSMGVDRIIAVELHSGQIQGFFPPRVPVTNLSSGYVGAKYFSEKKQLNKAVIVSPDAGGVQRAKQFRDVLAEAGHDTELDIALVVEHRAKDSFGHFPDEGADAPHPKLDLVGKVKDTDCIIVSDIIDTASTVTRAAGFLKEQGAKRVFAFAPHGLFLGGAVERIAQSELDEVVVTDTIPLNADAASLSKIRQVTLAPLLAETIKRVYKNQTVSVLFSPKAPNSSVAKVKRQSESDDVANVSAD